MVFPENTNTNVPNTTVNTTTTSNTTPNTTVIAPTGNEAVAGVFAPGVAPLAPNTGSGRDGGTDDAPFWIAGFAATALAAGWLTFRIIRG